MHLSNHGPFNERSSNNCQVQQTCSLNEADLNDIALTPCFPAVTTGSTGQLYENGESYQQDQLTSFLEDSLWMTDPSSMLAVDLPEFGHREVL
jgi:hypothetical protein